MKSASRSILLDTTVLIDVLHRRPKQIALLKQLIADGFELATSCVNAGELYAGTRPGEEAATNALVGSLTCYDLTLSIAQRAGEMVATRRKAGKTHSLADMMIAATAMEHGCQLLTDNVRDFQVPGLALFPHP